MSDSVDTVIIGAGPYGLSLAAHLAEKGVEHRIFGRPMLFWSQIAEAGAERYLKSYCFGTNLSARTPGFSFADYSRPRHLETFEPCSMADFAAYGRWFQQNNVAWAEPVDVVSLARESDRFLITLSDGERVVATQVVIAIGLSYFDYIPQVLTSLPSPLVTHTARIEKFASFKGMEVAVIGAGQSALEAAALLHEAGARPRLVIREASILWNTRVFLKRSLWRRLRSPISGLGTGPKAWALTHVPGGMHRMPGSWRTRFVKNHLPAEGAWWLRDRVENRVPIHLNTSVTQAREVAGRAALRLRTSTERIEQELVVDHVVAGTGYNIDVDGLDFVDPQLKGAIVRLAGAPKLNAYFESTVPALHFIGPASAMSFGPLFRFVVGADYAARTVSARLASRASRPGEGRRWLRSL